MPGMQVSIYDRVIIVKALTNKKKKIIDYQNKWKLIFTWILFRNWKWYKFDRNIVIWNCYTNSCFNNEWEKNMKESKETVEKINEENEKHWFIDIKNSDKLILK